MYDPSKSPLPLIKGPGLDNQIVPWVRSFRSLSSRRATPAPKITTSTWTVSGCAVPPRTRMNPNSTTILDFGVPGITLHEANVLHQPQTSTCKELPGIPGLLSQVVSEESGTFWPVLLNYTKLGGHLTEVNAAASVHPTLATVWLGANDWLKYMGSGGRFVGGDRTAAQVETRSARHDRHAAARGRKGRRGEPARHSGNETLRASLARSEDHKLCRIRTYANCVMIASAGAYRDS